MDSERHGPQLSHVDARLEHFEERNGFLRALLGLAQFARRAEAALEDVAKVPSPRPPPGPPTAEAYVLLGALELSTTVRRQVDAMFSEGESAARSMPPEPTRVDDLLR